MKQIWLKNTFFIAALYVFRMLGLFMLIPVFTVYAPHLNGSTPALLGLALGAYGLTQGLFQMPFGLLSDRYGRKRLITIGLILFMLGSGYGAITHSIYGMILARTLQGAGAIGSVLTALLADITPDSHRTKAMAVIGAAIGLSFSLAMILSPALTHVFGLSSLFYLSVILSILGLIILHRYVPTPEQNPFAPPDSLHLARLMMVIRNRHLQRLNVSIFLQHLILTATFFALPMLLQEQIKQGSLSHTWHFYFILTLGALLTMSPIIFFSEKKHWVKAVFVSSVALTSFAQLTLALQFNVWVSLCGMMFIYFVAFNLLEANIPALVSKQANPEQKGTAMGIYSSCQFLGIFVGGSVSGLLYQWHGHAAIFTLNGLLALLWLWISVSLNPFEYERTESFAFTKQMNGAQLISELKALPGVRDVVIADSEQMIYLRVENHVFKRERVEDLLKHFF